MNKEKYKISKSINDDLMDCVDRLGSESDEVDDKVWDHILIYALTDKLFREYKKRIIHDE